MNPTTTANAPQERRAATLVMACLGVFVAYLPVTTVSASLPAVQRALDASTSQLSWFSDAFVLPMAALGSSIPISPYRRPPHPPVRRQEDRFAARLTRARPPADSCHSRTNSGP